MASRDIYYIPHGSKWPIVGTLSLFITFLGGAMMFNNAPGSCAEAKPRAPRAPRRLGAHALG